MRRSFQNIPPFSVIAFSVSLTVGALIVYPIAAMAYTVFFQESAANSSVWGDILADGSGAVLLDTASVITASVVVATLVGTMFAWLVERTDIGMAGLTRFLPVMPILVPPIAGAIGWVLLASPRSGFLNRWVLSAASLVGLPVGQPLFNIYSFGGLVFVLAIYLVPNVFLSVASHLRNLDAGLEEAARVSGAGIVRILIGVTIPSVKPAVISGMTLAFIMGISLFSVPAVIGVPAKWELLAVRIVRMMTVSYPPQTAKAIVLALFIALVVGVAWWIQARALTDKHFSTIGGRGAKTTAVTLGALKWPFRALFLVYLAIASMLPFVALLTVSFQPFWTPVIKLSTFRWLNYRTIFLDNIYSQTALFNSLALGVIGASIGMTLGAVIAFFVDRNRAHKGAILIDGLTKLPAAVSHLVIAIAFVVAFSGAPFYLYGTTALLLLAYLVLYIPQATLSASTALAQVGSQLIEAALTSGASQGRTFLRITTPLMSSGLMAGWTLLFVLICGDITASAMLAGTRNPVVGFVILDLWTNGSFPQLAALGTVITILSSIVVLTAMFVSERTMRGERRRD